MQVRLRLIDGFELRCDGEPVPVQLGAQRLVAYLALRNQALLRVHVAGALWLDHSEERSCANLRSALWRLRSQAPSVVEATATHARLSRQVEVDLHEVVGLARGVLDAPSDAAAEEVDARRLAGDLLPDWYDDWVLHERERLRQLRVHALERLASRSTELGRFSRAIETALTAIQADPLRESAHRILIRAYLAEGNASAGMRQYELYRRRASEELGLEPSPQLREMVAGLV
jgi:DNA-binding SARP family transcriptional activator